MQFFQSTRRTFGLSLNASLLVCAASLCAGSAAASPVSFTENFSSNTAGPNLTLGANPGGATVSYASDAFTVTSGDGARVYLGTNSADYANLDSTFTAVATLPNTNSDWSWIFFGMGSAKAAAGYYYEPDFTPDVVGYINRTNFADHNDSTTTPNTIGNATPTSLSGPFNGAGTTGIQLDWNAETHTATLWADPNYNGSNTFVHNPLYKITATNTGLGTGNSQFFFGGGNQVSFTDITVTVVPEPSSVALLALSAVGLCVAVRRRKAG